MTKALKTALLALLLAASEAFAQFCPGLPPWVFDDVPSTHPFCTDITWMAERSVTLGCSAIDPNHRLYCPDREITRAEMAAFMHRLGDALFPLTCAAGQVMKWNGLAWACASDNIGGAGGGGTVTSVAAGIGLSSVPNPIVGAGVIDVAPAYRLPQACAANQIAKWNGSAWLCAADAAGIGTVTSLTAGAGIMLTPNPIVGSGTVAADTTYLQRRVSVSCHTGQSIRTIYGDGSIDCEFDDGVNAFVQGGNAFGATATLGTTDARALELVVQGQRALRLLYVDDAVPAEASINLAGGHPNNQVVRTCPFLGCLTGDPVRGGTVAGGGQGFGGLENRVSDSYGFVGGGAGNFAGNDNADHDDADFAAVVGGRLNTASRSGSFVGGGFSNLASGIAAAIPGGQGNQAAGFNSFAAGAHAHANADGCFVWADSSSLVSPASCNTANLFVARATGGFQLRTNLALSTGCVITAGGGMWNCSSSRDLKEGFTDIDPLAILDRVVTMPISTWRYRTETSGATHLGPMSEDFREAFGLGTSSEEIGLLDAPGVALAAIQGLNAKLETQLNLRDAIIDAQAREIAALRRAVEGVLARTAPDGALARMP